MLNKSAAFLILAMLCRNLEASVTNTYLSDFMKAYFDDPTIPEEQRNKSIYPIICSIVSISGPMFCNWSTYLMIRLIGEENPMAIPYVCMFRMSMTIPSMCLLWLTNSPSNGFWLSITGFIMR